MDLNQSQELRLRPEYSFQHLGGRAVTEEVFEAAYLRMKVWAGTEFAQLMGEKVQDWLDEFEEVSEHFFVRAGDELVAYTRVTPFKDFLDLPYSEFASERAEDPPGPIGYFSRLVVAESHQGWGIGKFLGQKSVEFSKAEGYRTAYGEASDAFVNSMKKLGFEVLQPRRLGLGCEEDHFTGLVKRL